MKRCRKIIALGVIMLFCMSMAVFAAPIEIDKIKKNFEDEITAYALWECFLCGKRMQSRDPSGYSDCKQNPRNGKHDWRVIR